MRFRREAEALARVAARASFRCTRRGVDAGAPYSSWRLIRAARSASPLRGRTVRLARGGHRSSPGSLARSSAATPAGIVHRDMKPENVLFDEEGRPCVADFGCVRDCAARSLTETGDAHWDAAYMAPEQLDGAKVDAESGTFLGAGVMLHELVSGAPPLKGRSPVETLTKRLRERPPSLRTARSAARAQCTRGARSRSLAERPADRGPLAQALAHLNASKKAPARRARSRWLLLVLLGGTVLLASHGKHASNEPAGDAAAVASAGATPRFDAPTAKPRTRAAVLDDAVELLQKASALDVDNARDKLEAALAVADSASATKLVAAARERIEREARSVPPPRKSLEDVKRDRVAYANAEKALEVVRRLGQPDELPASFVDLVARFNEASDQTGECDAGLVRGLVLCGTNDSPSAYAKAVLERLGGGHAAPLEQVPGEIASVESAIALAPAMSDLEFVHGDLLDRMWVAKRDRTAADRAFDASGRFLNGPDPEKEDSRVSQAHEKRAFIDEFRGRSTTPPSPSGTRWRRWATSIVAASTSRSAAPARSSFAKRDEEAATLFEKVGLTDAAKQARSGLSMEQRLALVVEVRNLNDDPARSGAGPRAPRSARPWRHGGGLLARHRARAPSAP